MTEGHHQAAEGSGLGLMSSHFCFEIPDCPVCGHFLCLQKQVTKKLVA